MRILLSSSEVFPFAKTGGLADVVGSLPRALLGLGHEVAIALPYYRCIREKGIAVELVVEGVPVPLGGDNLSVDLYLSHQPGSDIPTFLVGYDPFYDRPELYSQDDREYPDNLERFALFNRALLEGLPHWGFQPDILHLNDWHTGLVQPYLQEFYRSQDFYRRIATVFTIHNLGYKGYQPKDKFPITGLPQDYLQHHLLGDGDGWAMIKGGFLAPVVNTVSPRYAEEIQTEEFGFGLDKDLRRISDKLYGVINGIDYSVWNPATDGFIAQNFSREDIAGKTECRRALQKEVALPQRDDPLLVGVVSRLSKQKGFDIFSDIASQFIESGAQLVVLGTGVDRYEDIFRKLAGKYPKQCSATISYDRALAHRIYAGCDAFLMPSGYEPCGLSQMISMAYGTVPVVRAVGGLADTVINLEDADVEEIAKVEATGFTFTEYSGEALLSALRRCLKAHQNLELWGKLSDNCFAQDFSWDESAKRYVELYEIAARKM